MTKAAPRGRKVTKLRARLALARAPSRGMAALEIVPLYASDLPQTQNPGECAMAARATLSTLQRSHLSEASLAGPQDPYALVSWGGAEAATTPHLGTRPSRAVCAASSFLIRLMVLTQAASGTRCGTSSSRSR